MKKILLSLLTAAIVFSVVSCDNDGVTPSTENAAAAESEAEAIAAAEYFSDSDTKDVSSEAENATVTLEGESGTISDTARGSSGSNVVITSKGVYRVTGSSQNVSVVVRDDNKSGNVYLILDNVTMENLNYSCISVEAADKVIICLVGENTLKYTAKSSDYDGAIYASDDLTINGAGALYVTSSLHGIVCKNDLKLTGGTVSVTASSIGIKAKDSVRIGGCAVTVNSGHDGVQVNSSETGPFFHIGGGSLAVNAGYDGIDVGTTASVMTGFASFAGGTVSITAGGGSGNSKDSKVSQKGVKCDGKIVVSGANLTVDSADDALNSSSEVNLISGAVTLSSSDDGIHADNVLGISGGELSILKSYEGLEAYEIGISGGATTIYASDDGINAAGGSDTQSTEEEPGRWSMNSSAGTLRVSGGMLYVNAGGDGLDANDSLYVSGGTVIVEGPTDNGNGALDLGNGSGCVAEITGGTVLAIGSSGMAVNFDSGTQCSALLSLSGDVGTQISVDDGSGFTFTTTKSFSCVVYSSPYMKEGNTYTVTAGGSSASASFSSGLYYGNVSGGGPREGMK